MAIKIVKDTTTEQKIKEAAASIFQQKGYAATRTRDIADEAGINLALLNYYFRSKENLFKIIMKEKFITFFGHIIPVAIDATTTLDYKIKMIANSYIDMLIQNPELPLFVISELRNNEEQFLSMVQNAELIFKSPLAIQLKEKNETTNPIHFILNTLGLCIFPFVMKPGLQKILKLGNKEFLALMEERRQLVPKWANAMIKTK